MNWYLAKLRFQGKGSGHACSQCQDDQWRIIRADEMAWAIEKATVIGWLQQQGAEEDNASPAQEFLGVAEILQIPDFEDGAQILQAI